MMDDALAFPSSSEGVDSPTVQDEEDLIQSGSSEGGAMDGSDNDLMEDSEGQSDIERLPFEDGGLAPPRANSPCSPGSARIRDGGFDSESHDLMEDNDRQSDIERSPCGLALEDGGLPPSGEDLPCGLALSSRSSAAGCDADSGNNDVSDLPLETDGEGGEGGGGPPLPPLPRPQERHAFCWAQRVLLSLLCFVTMPVLLSSMLLNEPRVSTSFSGIGTAEHAARFLKHASGSIFGRAVSLNFVSACDNKRSNRDVIGSLLPGACIYKDILDASAVAKELFEQAPQAVDFKSTWDLLVAAGAHLRARRCAPCGCHCPSPTAIDVEIAGPPCQPWSSLGSRLGKNSRLVIIILVWFLLLRATQPLVVIFENVVGFDMELLQHCLGSLYHIVALKVRPCHVGFTRVARRRLYCVLYLRKKVRILLPVQDVYNFVTRGFACNSGAAESYVCASASQVMAAENAARLRRNLQPVSQISRCWAYLLSEGQQRHLAEYTQRWTTQRQQPPANCPDCVFNLSQNPSRRASQTSTVNIMPTITGSSIFWVPALRRWLLPMELAASHGFPVTETMAAKAGVPVDPNAESYTVPQIGNSMHLANIGCVTAVALACAAAA